MDLFDFKTGSLYAVLAIASCVYLLWGLKIRVRSLLKAILAVQLLGDLIFFNSLLNMPVYTFVKTLTAEDRIYPLLMLMAGVFLMDGGAAILASRKKARHAGAGPAPSGASGPLPANLQKDSPLKLNEDITRKVGTLFIMIAVVSKGLELYFSGVLDQPSLLIGILSWQPEMSVGFAFLGSIGLTLFPIGVVFRVMCAKSKPHWLGLLLIFGYGFLSPWKGDVVRLTILYGFAIAQFGMHELKQVIFGKASRITFAAILLFLPLKAQFRAGQIRGFSEDWKDPDSLAEDFVGAVGARVMGGVFQSYVYVVNSLERGYPTMGGQYNVQALYLWVPRLLWTSKPEIASEQVYYYLEMTKAKDEPYGTSFATTVFGTFFLDFGFWGGLVCAFILGGLISAGERFLVWVSNSRNELAKVYSVAFTVLWLNSTFPLSEGGVPPAFTGLLLGCAVFVMTSFPFWTMASSTSRKTPESVRGLPTRSLVRGVATKIVR